MTKAIFMLVLFSVAPFTAAAHKLSARQHAQAQRHQVTDGGARAAAEAQARFREEQRKAQEEQQLVAAAQKIWKDEASKAQSAEPAPTEESAWEDRAAQTDVDTVQKTMAAAASLSQRLRDEAAAVDEAAQTEQPAEGHEAARPLDEITWEDEASEDGPDPTGKELEAQIVKTSSVANFLAQDAETLAKHLAKLDGALRTGVAPTERASEEEPAPAAHHKRRRGRKEAPAELAQLAPNTRRVQSFISKPRRPQLNASDAKILDFDDLDGAENFSDAYKKGRAISFALNTAEDQLFSPPTITGGLTSWFALIVSVVIIGACCFCLPWKDVLKRRKDVSNSPEASPQPVSQAAQQGPPVPVAASVPGPVPADLPRAIPMAMPPQAPAQGRPYTFLRS